MMNSSNNIYSDSLLQQKEDLPLISPAKRTLNLKMRRRYQNHDDSNDGEKYPLSRNIQHPKRELDSNDKGIRVTEFTITEPSTTNNYSKP